MAGTATWGKQPKKTQRYNKECIVTQCFKCHQYGHLSKSCKGKEVCGYCSSKEHVTKAHPNPKDKTTLKCALCGGQHTAWAGVCPKRKAVLTKIAEAKRELLENPYFPECVVTPGVSGRPSRETSDNGRPRRQRQPTEEVIEVVMDNDRDELGEEPNQLTQQSTQHSTLPLDFGTSGLDASAFFYREPVPQTPNTRALRNRVQASSPIFRTHHMDAIAPRSTRNRVPSKRKTAIATGVRGKKEVVYSMETGATKTVFESDSDPMEITAQDTSKRVCTTSADTNATDAEPADKTSDTLQPCLTVAAAAQDGEGDMSMAESAGDGGSEMSRLSQETRSSGTKNISARPNRLFGNNSTTPRPKPLG
jgi:hypothetical protein